MTIIIVTDNEVYANGFSSLVKKAFDSPPTIAVVPSEHAFNTLLENFKQDPPEAFVIHTNIRWCDPGPEMPKMPEEVLDQGAMLAGSRMYWKIRNELKEGIFVALMTTVMESTPSAQEPHMTVILNWQRLSEMLKKAFAK